jgi:plastocyanin
MDFVSRLSGIARIVLPVVLPVCPSLHAGALDHLIRITGDGFEPDYLVVQVGDTVTWWNEDAEGDDYHSTTCSAYPWNSPRLYFQYRACLTLTRSGTFNYECAYCEFSGTLVVTPANPPAVPVITAPSVLTNGHFQFTVTNLVIGQTNFVETSTNLANGTWTRIQTNVASGYSYAYTDPATVFGRRFYRVSVLP